MKTRQQILQTARQQWANVVQLFNDVDHWNKHVRKPDEDKIEADPDGQMMVIKQSMERLLTTETRKDLKVPEGCNLLACHTGEGWILYYQREADHQVFPEEGLEWPEGWPDSVDSSWMHAHGFETN